MTCKYYKNVNVTECCKGYAGVSCDQLIKPDNPKVDLPEIHDQSHSVCALWGRDHFRTFNKQFFTFNGDCNYQLSTHKGGWQIILRMSGCKDISSCQKTLKMFFGNVVIHATGDNITVDGIGLEKGKGYMKEAIMIESHGDFYQLRFSDGVSIKWSVDSLTILLTIENQYRSKVLGMCGDYSSFQENDMALRDTTTYTTNGYSFGNNWKTDSTVSRLIVLNYFKMKFYLIYEYCTHIKYRFTN